ncbi:MAG: winged helix DNA-binding domain-containing protein [Oligoflexia bacterium]|nr:winged helix DNA-binding domain-containing protein [Oligoflexia bacterium]
MQLTKEEARTLILKAQFSHPENSITSVFQNIGYVQIDSINVVERAHHHILWSRNSNYRPNQLNDLFKKKAIFEYWSHAASILPMRDFRFSLLRKKDYQSGKKHFHNQSLEVKQWKKKILKKFSGSGPLSTRDFIEERKTKGGWFEWKPSKIALEQLFMEGHLMVSHREGIEKYYDLSDRIVGKDFMAEVPTKEEYADYLIETCLKASAIASLHEIAYLRKKDMRDLIEKRIKRFIKEDFVKTVKIKGLPQTYFMFSNLNIDLTPVNTTRLLSPFDNLVIQRKRLQDLFDFDFFLECYVPKAKRKYGYFCLPILSGNSFLGRIDLKFDRQESKLKIQNLTWEKKVKIKKAKENLDLALREYADFLSCESVDSIY